MIKSDKLKTEPSITDIEDKHDIGDEDSAPDIRYIKYCHDLPKKYCCRAMKEGIEDLASLRSLLSVMQARYMREKGWDIDEVDRYWDLYREGKSQEEAEKIVEQERIKSKSIPPM